MFSKMFGGTEVEQLKYLKVRVILTAACFAAMLVGALLFLCGLGFGAGLIETGGGALAIMALVWAWSFMRAWFGWASLGALFTGNIVLGVVIMVLYVTIGYIFGLIAMCIGIGRFIYLSVKKHQQGLTG